MGDIWVTSDPHLFHDRPFLYEPRLFKSVYDMNSAIITNWNKTVDCYDDVFVCGDLMLNDTEAGLQVINMLNGRLHIVAGNHDTDERLAAYSTLKNVVDVEFGYRLKVGNWRFLITHYPTLVGVFDDTKAPTRQLYNICGHSHTKDVWADWDKGRIFHCEMDTHDCTPWNINEIIDMLRRKTNG